MRVAMWYNNHDIQIEELPIPQIGPDEALLKVEASGICGSDTLEWYRINRAPLVLGHEVAGELVAVGGLVRGYGVGDRVAVAHHVPCNTCHYCLNGHHTVCDTLRQTNFDPGGFSEYIRIPAINVDRGIFPLPDELSFEEGSFAEPVACVLRGQRQAGLQPGHTVLVLGSGIAGLLHVQLARAMGAGRVIATDIDFHRLEMACQFGATSAIHAEDDLVQQLKRINDGRLADIVVVSTGARIAISQALSTVERGGTILFFAPTDPDFSIPIPINDFFFRNDITLTTSYAGSPSDYKAALELLRSCCICVKGMITHRLSLEETQLGFHLMTHPQEQSSIKVIIEPHRSRLTSIIASEAPQSE